MIPGTDFDALCPLCRRGGCSCGEVTIVEDPTADRNTFGEFAHRRMLPVLDRLSSEATRGERNGWTDYARRRRERVAEINCQDAIAFARLGDGSGVGEVAARKVVDMIRVHERGDEVESWYSREVTP